MSEPGPGQPGTGPWREAEASRLIEFGRAAALPDGGFGWLGTDGRIDPAQPRPLYINARMTYVFALAHLTGVADAGALAASGLGALASRYADREHGGWFASLDSAGNVLDTAKANYAHAHVLLAASSALAAGIPGADAALEAATAAVDRHFWSDAEGLALESWNAGFTEPEAYRGANSNMHSVEAYLAAGDLLAVVSAGYDDLPQLLAFALHDRLGDHLHPSVRHRPQEIRVVIDPDGELLSVFHRGRSAEAGRALDGGCVHPAVHHSPRRMVLLIQVDPTANLVPTYLLDPQPRDTEKLAVVSVIR